MTPEHSADYACIGGPLDGQRHACEGARLIMAEVTPEYRQAYSEWAEKYLVAWAFETIDGIPEWPVTPPPPNYPQQVYRLTAGDDGEPYLLHIDGPGSAE